jgi:HD-GYP domain-containing protein (c-di-GMP phosphodiesterase class II)
MKDHEDEVVGVLQLLNARKGISRKICSFSEEDIPMVQGLAAQAAVAVSNVRLVQDLENLLKAFIKSIAAAIDEKSPYTSGHIQRVAKLTEMLVDRINQTDTDYFADTQFSKDKVDEISIAAWMHDVGKIATPEYIVDKSTKLETVCDRLEIIRLRIELMKRDQEIQQLRAKLPSTAVQEIFEEENNKTDFDEMYRFLCQINIGGEFMTEKDLLRLKDIAAMSYRINGELFPLLNRNEVGCCAIPRGTLTDEERLVINHHVVVSSMMLNQLPFPKKWRCVPEYAGMHHEKLNGGGYPNGYAGDDISLPARILAVADVFEALTAADRPYKVGKKLSEAMQIMKFMADTEHLDKHLCDFLVESGVVAEYAEGYLDKNQIDSYIWRGKEY